MPERNEIRPEDICDLCEGKMCIDYRNGYMAVVTFFDGRNSHTEYVQGTIYHCPVEVCLNDSQASSIKRVINAGNN